VAIRKTPLSDLAEPERKRIAKAIERGRALRDPSDAEMAVAYAIWILRRHRISIIVWFVLGGASLFNTIQHQSQSIGDDVFTAVAVVLFVAWTVLERLALRSFTGISTHPEPSYWAMFGCRAQGTWSHLTRLPE
jgi:hypothetical protein